MTTVCTHSRVKLYRDRRELVQRIDALDFEIALPCNAHRRGELKAFQYTLKMKIAALDAYLHGEAS